MVVPGYSDDCKGEFFYEMLDPGNRHPRCERRVFTLTKNNNEAGDKNGNCACVRSTPISPGRTRASLLEWDIAWWGWTIIAIAVTTTAVNIIYLLRYHLAKRADKQRKDTS
jgi:hypothetical protein